MLTKWDIRYLKLAREISSWSKDGTKIGAVAIRNKRVLVTGYNGFPEKISDTPERYQNREIKYKLVIHAEMNCVLQAVQHGIDLTGATFYIYGLPVCDNCAKHIVASGVVRVVCCYDQSKQHSPQWIEGVKFVDELFTEAGIGLEIYDLPDIEG